MLVACFIGHFSGLPKHESISTLQDVGRLAGTMVEENRNESVIKKEKGQDMLNRCFLLKLKYLLSSSCADKAHGPQAAAASGAGST